MPERNKAANARLHREWLKKLPTVVGKPLTRIALEASVSPSTLTRPLQEGEDGTSTLHANTIGKIIAAFGVDPPPGVTLPRSEGVRAGGGEDAAPYTAGADSPLGAAVAALAAHSDQISPWTLQTRALELAGYMPGDVVLVDFGNTTPLPGQVVCAEVFDMQSGRVETVMRLFERARPVDLLVARSTDPAFAAPIVVDGERVVIRGVLMPHRLRPV